MSSLGREPEMYFNKHDDRHDIKGIWYQRRFTKKGGTVWYSIFQQKYGVGLHMISHPQIRKGVLTYELHTIFGHCREGREEKNAD